MLEREREVPSPDGKFSSLWKKKVNTLTGQISWFHLVTQREVDTEPKESKGAILADDVRWRFYPSSPREPADGLLLLSRWVSEKPSQPFPS